MAFLRNSFSRGTRKFSAAPLIVYVDEGCEGVEDSHLETALIEAVAASQWNGKETQYFIAFCWATDGTVMVDLWRFTENPVDKVSGPLADLSVFQNGKKQTGFGVASGNTLLILGIEEQHRRRCRTLTAYLKASPRLPKGLIKPPTPRKQF